MTRSGAERARRPSIVVVVAAVVAVAALVVGCSSSPGTQTLQTKLRQVNGLSAFQAKCVATELDHALTDKEMRTVASADGRGGIADADLSQKVTKAVSACVVATTTTTVPGQVTPGSSTSGATTGSTTAPTLEP
jgi:hypothetical protein